MPAIIPIAMVAAAAISSNSSSKASKAQAQAGRDASSAADKAQTESIAFQERQAAQARADREPWRAAGVNALTEMVQRTGPNGDLMRDFAMSDFQKDPGYQFRMDEGMKGLTNSAAARGGLLSGAALKAASQYNQNFASNEYGTAFNRFKGNQEGKYNKLASLAGVGQVQANQNGSNAMQMGQNVGAGMMQTGQQIGNNLMGAGNARASGYLAQGNALGNMLNQGASWYNQNYNNTPPPSYMDNNAQNVQPGSSGTWNG